MRKTRCTGNAILSLFLTLLINLDGTIPAFILLGLHWWLGWPIWLFWGALGIWFVSVLVHWLVIRWVSRCSNAPEKRLENKNPYSVGQKGN